MSTKNSKTGIKEDPALKLALEMAKLAVDKKGTDTVIFDLQGISPITDFFVITTGLSTLHTRAMADHMNGRENPYHTEGLESGHWILIDYVDVIVHIFTQETREFYGLERLWGDAPVIELKDDPTGN